MTDSAAAMLKTDHAPASAKGKAAVAAAAKKAAEAAERATKDGLTKPPGKVDRADCKTVVTCQAAAQEHIEKVRDPKHHTATQHSPPKDPPASLFYAGWLRAQSRQRAEA